VLPWSSTFPYGRSNGRDTFATPVNIDLEVLTIALLRRAAVATLLRRRATVTTLLRTTIATLRAAGVCLVVLCVVRRVDGGVVAANVVLRAVTAAYPSVLAIDQPSRYAPLGKRLVAASVSAFASLTAVATFSVAAPRKARFAG
jgi:hypothetical protein